MQQNVTISLSDRQYLGANSTQEQQAKLDELYKAYAATMTEYNDALDAALVTSGKTQEDFKSMTKDKKKKSLAHKKCNR